MKKRKLGIVVDSTIGGDLGKSIFPDLSVVPLSIIFENKVYLENDFTNNDLFQLKKKDPKAKVTTSQPNPQLFLKAFEQQFALGYEHILCLTISQKLSGTFQSAQKAQQMLGNPNITVIDSENAGPGMLFTLKAIAKYLNEKPFLSYKDIYAKVIEEQNRGSLLFYLDSLKQLTENKRISFFKYFLGSLLNIKPILRFQKGILIFEKKPRSWKNCFQYLLKCILDFKQEYRNVEIKLIYVDKTEYMDLFQKEIEALKDSHIQISVYGYISPVIAVHLGSGGFGFYLNKIIE